MTGNKRESTSLIAPDNQPRGDSKGTAPLKRKLRRLVVHLGR